MKHINLEKYIIHLDYSLYVMHSGINDSAKNRNAKLFISFIKKILIGLKRIHPPT